VKNSSERKGDESFNIFMLNTILIAIVKGRKIRGWGVDVDQHLNIKPRKKNTSTPTIGSQEKY